MFEYHKPNNTGIHMNVDLPGLQALLETRYFCQQIFGCWNHILTAFSPFGLCTTEICHC